MLLIATIIMSLAVAGGAALIIRFLNRGTVIQRTDLILVFAGTLITINAGVHLVISGMNGLDVILIIVGLGTEYAGTMGLARSLETAS